MSRERETQAWAQQEYLKRITEDQGTSPLLSEDSLRISDVKNLFSALETRNCYLVVEGEVVMNGNSPLLVTPREARETKKAMLEKNMLLKIDIIDINESN